MPGQIALTIPFIFTLNSVTERIHPWGTPISCSPASEIVLPTRTRKKRLFKKAEKKKGGDGLEGQSHANLSGFRISKLCHKHFQGQKRPILHVVY